MEQMIRTVNLTRVFNASDVETMALNGVDLMVDKGEFVSVMGPSGCGKSTLLSIIGLLDAPTGGDYFFEGVNVAGFPERQRARLRKRRIGYIFQNFNLIEELTLFENIELPLVYIGTPAKERRERVMTLLEKIELAHRKDNFPIQLSGGQQQRVAVARALVADPSLLLADEPTGNLDSRHGEEVMELLAGLNDTGTTIVMVTHSERDAEYAGRIINLFDGRIISENY